MTPCRLLLDEGLIATPGRSPDGERTITIVAPTANDAESPGLATALGLMTIGAMAASLWWVLVILLIL